MDPTPLALSLLAGIATGFVFFGGLWWTLRRAARSSRPYRLVFASFVLRMALLLVVFRLLLEGGHWQRGVAALVGVILARIVLVARLGRRPPEATSGIHDKPPAGHNVPPTDAGLQPPTAP